MSKSVVVYGVSEGCRFCNIAKQTLHERGIPFKFVDISQDGNFLEFFKTVHTTVPQIYVNGKVVEGGSEAAKTINIEEEILDFEEDDLDW